MPSNASPDDSLSRRIEARRRQLEAEIVRLKDQASDEAARAARRARERLEELQDLVRNGWDDLSAKALARLHELLDGGRERPEP